MPLQADVSEAFAILGRRPEMLRTILGELGLGTEKADELKTTLRVNATALRERLWEDYDHDYEALTPLQRVVLAQLIRQGARFAPFAASSLGAYSAAAGERVVANDAQSALDALRQKNIVWRSSRGVYTLEDQGMAEWFAERYPEAKAP